MADISIDAGRAVRYLSPYWSRQDRWNVIGKWYLAPISDKLNTTPGVWGSSSCIKSLHTSGKPIEKISELDDSLTEQFSIVAQRYSLLAQVDFDTRLLVHTPPKRCNDVDHGTYRGTID